MIEEVEFLFDNQLVNAIEKLIKSAKKELLLVSPFIDLDPRICDALNEKRDQTDFQLSVLFGKNENNVYKSIKRNSLEVFKQFPDVEIRYNERLHAKYFQNDFEYIMTSMNLYDYSLAKNIEVGVRGKYASRGLFARAYDVTNGLLGMGIEKLNQRIFGAEEQMDHINKFFQIFESSELLYKNEPRFSESSGLLGIGSRKKLDGYDTVENKFKSEFAHSSNYTTTTTIDKKNEHVIDIDSNKYLSASQLGKKLRMSTKDVNNFMQKKGLIIEDAITELGKSKGVIMKNYMGNNYIAYPGNLEELSELGS